uniref:Hemicentin-1-like n=1 Tax=Saccoglossus kowalevskii TaxID=10224 RepID=A0ABM0MUK3_SACKO
MFITSVILLAVLTTTLAGTTITVPGSPITTIETTTTILECTYTTTGVYISTTWFKGSTIRDSVAVILKESGIIYNQPGFTRHGIQDQASLVINNTQLSDADKYWCLITAIGGSEEESITLTVTAATPPSEPTIAVTGGNPSNVGSLVRLKCTSNGTPTPIYTWLRDNLPLPALIRYQLNSDNSRLTIDPTDKDDNGKTFTCQVTNGKGSKDEDITLSIQ